MTGHHNTPGGTDAPQFLVTTTHRDGVVCHHTGATMEEVKTFASEHAAADDEVSYWMVAPYRIDGIHWQLIA